MGGMSFPGSGNSQCKGPEVGCSGEDVDMIGTQGGKESGRR